MGPIRYSSSACCLDEGLSYRFRRQVQKSRFFDALIQNFLMQLFFRMILSTQFVECIFAMFRTWLLAGKGGTIWSTGRKHMSHQFMTMYQNNIVDDMLQGIDRAVARSGRSRPAWVATWKHGKMSDVAASFRGRCISEFKAAAHCRGEVFDRSAALTTAHQRWRARSASEKKKDMQASQRAALIRPHVSDPLRRIAAGYKTDGGPEAKLLSPW